MKVMGRSRKKSPMHVFHVGSVYCSCCILTRENNDGTQNKYQTFPNHNWGTKKNNKNMLKMSLPEGGFA